MIISDQERILSIADKVILMNSGKIEQVTNKDEILKRISQDTVCCKLKGGVDDG